MLRHYSPYFQDLKKAKNALKTENKVDKQDEVC